MPDTSSVSGNFFDYFIKKRLRHLTSRFSFKTWMFDDTKLFTKKYMGKILGLDVGDKTIGVAISDELKWTAQGLMTLKREGKKKDIPSILHLVETHNIEKIVIGLPKNMNNTLGEQAEKVLKFSKILETRLTAVSVILWDERLTTSAADKVLLQANVSRKKRKHVINTLSAVLILQTYLDAQSFLSNPL